MDCAIPPLQVFKDLDLLKEAHPQLSALIGRREKGREDTNYHFKHNLSVHKLNLTFYMQPNKRNESML